MLIRAWGRWLGIEEGKRFGSEAGLWVELCGAEERLLGALRVGEERKNCLGRRGRKKIAKVWGV